MVCRNCGKQLQEGEKFCTICGYYNEKDLGTPTQQGNTNIDIVVPEEPPEMRNNNEFNEDNYDTKNLININNSLSDNSSQEQNFMNINYSSNNNLEINDNRYDRLLEAYVGEDYQEIVRKKINIYAFLFNLFYLLYRKLYVLGIVGLVILWVIGIKFSILLIPYLLVIAFLSGVLFNPIYLKLANIKIKRIRKNNPSNDDFELMEICRKKGGVNVVIALVIYVIFIACIIFSMFSFNFNLKGRGKYWEANNNNRANCMYITKNSLLYTKNNSIEGELVEAACRKFGADTSFFDIYIKMKNFDGSVSYLFFQTGDQELTLTNNTVRKSTLENKKMTGTITPEETKQLEEIQEIESNYKKIKEESAKFDKQAVKDNDKTERTCYVFTKEELLR